MKVTLIAVGNCGYNIANDIIETGIITPAHYFVCDTDVDELQNKALNPKCKTIMLPFFDGNPNTDQINLVSDIVPEDSDIVLLCAGMGGCTGSRYAPLISMSAQILNKNVISVFATAFHFEGEDVQMRSKLGFLQQQIASDLCIYQDNNCLNKELMLAGMNDPLLYALNAIKAKRPITEWTNLPTAEFKEIMIETARESGPVMIQNFYSKAHINFDSRERMFNEIIAINS